MLETSIREIISTGLKQCASCLEPNHFLCVMKDDVVVTHNNLTINFNARFIPLTVEQVKNGFSPRGWNAIVKKVVKALDDIEKL